MSCMDCPFYKPDEFQFIPSELEHHRVMIIQDTPDPTDLEHQEQFFGKSCGNFMRALARREVEDVYFTSMAKCFVNGDLGKKQLDACKPYIEHEIKVVDPDIIIPMGNAALKYTYGKVGLTKQRGNAVELELAGRQRIIFPMLHPRTTMAKPANKSFILTDLDNLQDLYNEGMTQVTQVDYRHLETVEECRAELVRMKNEAKVIAFDLETTGKNPFLPWSKIVCISLTDNDHYGVTIPLYKSDSPMNTMETGYVVKLLRWLMADPNIIKAAHNGKFDRKWLKYWLGIEVVNFSFDTQLSHYLAVSEEQGTQGLKSQAWEFTDMGGYDNQLDEYRDKVLKNGEGINSKYNYDRIPWPILKTYAAADVDCCLRLMKLYQPMIAENPQWQTLMDDIMMPASYALGDIEANGMYLDMTVANRYKESYNKEIARITDRLNSYPEVLQMVEDKRQMALERKAIMSIPKKDRTPEEQKKADTYKKYENYVFNWNSVIQLRELLFDRLGLVSTVTTEKGDPSTNEEAMDDLSKQHEIPSLLLELRKVTTLNNMFIKKLPGMVDRNSVVHGSFNLTGTVTGRLASEDPNLQQIPRKSEDPLSFQYHNEPKAMFSSRFGGDGCIMNADYSALEMRIACIISQDEALSKALLSGKDLHKSTASLVWGVPVDEVPKDMRTRAKSVNFGILPNS